MTIRRNVLLPSSGSKTAEYFVIVAYLPCSLNMKMEAVYSSETSMKFYGLTFHKIVLFIVTTLRNSNPKTIT
jgi:hypothetical protein